MKNEALKIFLFVSILLTSCGQQQTMEVKNGSPSTQTKMEAFTSKTGVIYKFTDHYLPALETAYSDATETRIRKLSSGSEVGYFYQIVKQGKYSSVGVSIEYTDLLEVIKALATLNTAVTIDLAANPDYLENKFVTTDGFEVGYFISRSKVNWYVKLERIGSDNTLFINSMNEFQIALVEAKNKIDSLKKSNN